MTANQGVAPPAFDTAVGQVRLLIGDTDPQNVSGGFGTYAFYSDAELTALLTLHGSDARRCAVACLRAIAITPALKLKKWSSADLMVDGPAITNSLLAAARAIESGINADAVTTGGDFVQIVSPKTPELRGIV